MIESVYVLVINDCCRHMSLSLRETVTSLEKHMQQQFIHWATNTNINTTQQSSEGSSIGRENIAKKQDATADEQTQDGSEESDRDLGSRAEAPPEIEQILIATLRISKLHPLLQV
jgi:hypothetical protein